MSKKAFLWPEPGAEAESQPLVDLIERAGLTLADSVADDEAAVFVHSAASNLQPNTLLRLVGRWAACIGTRPLHVSVAPNVAMKWHLSELARLTMDALHDWNPNGCRLVIPAEAVGERYWVEVRCRDGDRQKLWYDAETGSLPPEVDANSSLVVRVGESRCQPGDHELAAFDSGPLPTGKTLQIRVAVLGCDEAEADWRVPFALPGYTAFKARNSTWRNLRENGAVITGRQNAPEILKVTPTVMVGTGEQFRRWRELVQAGQAKGVEIEAAEAVACDAV